MKHLNWPAEEQDAFNIHIAIVDADIKRKRSWFAYGSNLSPRPPHLRLGGQQR